MDMAAGPRQMRKVAGAPRWTSLAPGDEPGAWSRRVFAPTLMLELIVPPAHSGTRLDRFLADSLAHLSRSRVQTLIRGGHVRLNTRAAKPAEALRAADVISWEEPPATPSALTPEPLDLAILYEDEDLLVVDKAPGMVTHPGPGNETHTLVQALLAHCTHLSGIGGERRPGIVHRLDKETSGCLVVAKNDCAHQGLAAQFAGRSTRKHYLALVHGTLAQANGTIDAPIGRHPVQRQKMAIVAPPRGRLARTDFLVRTELPGGGPQAATATLLECRLHTGRTHQIRVHLQSLGHPVIGDAVYGRKGHIYRAPAPRQLLHAWKLGFAHPRTGDTLEFRAPLPADFCAFGLEPAFA
jgi:23S rRNA pseudouridine1911/1915/1917 synthase